MAVGADLLALDGIVNSINSRFPLDYVVDYRVIVAIQDLEENGVISLQNQT